MRARGFGKVWGAIVAAGLVWQGVPLTNAQGATASVPFSDIANSYAKQQIVDLYQRGIVSGKGEGIYDPTAAITREEFVTMLDRALGLQPLPSVIASFADVPASRWSYPWVQAGSALGLVSGVSADQFAPEAKITREETAALLVRAVAANQTANTPAAQTVQLPFADGGQTSDWAKPSVYDANRLGLMQGDANRFRPRDAITREETAVVLSRILSRAIPASGSPKGQSGVQLGWQYGETDTAYLQKVEASGLINTLAPRWFFLQEDGTFEDVGNSSMVAWAHQHNLKIWPLVGNHFNQALTHQYLSGAESRQNLVRQLMALASKYGVDGLNIDFEGVGSTDRAAFTAFIRELSQAAHAQGVQISVDLPPNFGSENLAAYDDANLAKDADYLVLMGYDEHWNNAPRAGSVSSLPWLTRGIDSFVSVAPASKIIVGLPLYTRDWTVVAGKTVSKELTLPQQTNQLVGNGASMLWDAVVGQYVAKYDKSGEAHTIWVEDARSLAQKTSVALDRGVAGAAYWRIGGETNDVWKSLQNVWNYKRTVTRL